MKKLEIKKYDRGYEKIWKLAGGFNNSTLAINRVITGDVLSREKYHSHPKANEYYVFLKGKAEMLINDSVIEVSEGDVLLVEPGETHKVNKVVEEAEYIVVRDCIDENEKSDNPGDQEIK